MVTHKQTKHMQTCTHTNIQTRTYTQTYKHIHAHLQYKCSWGELRKREFLEEVFHHLGAGLGGGLWTHEEAVQLCHQLPVAALGLAEIATKKTHSQTIHTDCIKRFEFGVETTLLGTVIGSFPGQVGGRQKWYGNEGMVGQAHLPE